MQKRQVKFVVHAQRPAALAAAQEMEKALAKQGVSVTQEANLAQIVVAFGGDGTILDAISEVYGQDVPILGINMGHVGFLAEAEAEAIENVVQAIVTRKWKQEKRMTLQVEVSRPDGSTEQSWAVNEASVVKTASGRMIETVLGVDGHAISTFNTDGIVTATPTGSTAYAFSCGGPVVWPDVEALLVVPVAAHAIFTRPLVLGPQSVLQVQVLSEGATIWCDGRRQISCPPGTTVTVTRARQTVTFARISCAPFTDRLVRKFQLPTQGWRQIGGGES